MLMGLCFSSAITIIIIILTLMFKRPGGRSFTEFNLLPIKRVGFILSVNIFLFMVYLAFSKFGLKDWRAKRKT
jgi:hypothetical protein